MMPSRGLCSILRARASIGSIPFPQVRRISIAPLSATDPTNKPRIYISRSKNPYLNLSFEHHLLKTSPEDSTILFLYTNSPSVVIGRNQNPWKEVDLCRIRNAHPEVQLVRRRSGGGTVYHDEGNVNYSVICPTAAFHRDKHAHMVVRALQKLGVPKVRVNERHDIVIDKHVDGEEKAFKVSGSAYKLTRARAVHHGTCLLSIPNLEKISKYLHSPAAQFIEARGVDSVPSPIINVGLRNDEFEEAVVAEFEEMYPGATPRIIDEEYEKSITSALYTWTPPSQEPSALMAEQQEVVKGMRELTSEKWIYGQTPRFTFSYTSSEKSTPPTQTFYPPFPKALKHISFTFEHSQISSLKIQYSPMPTPTEVKLATAPGSLIPGLSLLLWDPSFLLTTTKLEGTRKSLKGHPNIDVSSPDIVTVENPLRRLFGMDKVFEEGV